MVTQQYTKRLITRIIMECETPLSLRSGAKSIITDAEVAKDVNCLPYIPGTSLAGVLRHSVSGTEAEVLFGKSGNEDGEGSKVIFTDALILGPDGKVIDGLAEFDNNDDFYYKYTHLPIRHHVAINGRGTGKDGGKFDNETVYAGTRFCFEMEVVADNDEDLINAKAIVSNLYKESFRIGGGSRNGYGAMKIISCRIKEYDLTDKDGLFQYLAKSNTLADDFDGAETLFEADKLDEKYTLTIKPDDVFLFGSGHGDDQVDTTPVVEDVVEWDNNKARFVKDCALIPASSIKGAVSHRLAFHFNKLIGRFSDIPDSGAKEADENEAVKALMGYEDSDNHIRGALIFNDIIIKQALHYCSFNHVRVDSFTAAAINGALFNEKAFFSNNESIETTILLNRGDFERNLAIFGTDCYKEKIIEALELTFNDLCNGLLPLGSLTNNGFGRFTGNWKKE